MTSIDPLLPFIPPGTVGAEVGVAQGDSSLALFRHGVRFLYLIDPWKMYPEYLESAGHGPRVEYYESCYREAMEKLSPYAGKHAQLRMTSAEAARFVPPQLDWVFLDGNHQYEFVRSDIHLYWPKVKPGGLLMGHDYCNAPPTCRVKDAVDEFLQDMRDQADLRLELPLPCWFVRKR